MELISFTVHSSRIMAIVLKCQLKYRFFSQDFVGEKKDFILACRVLGFSITWSFEIKDKDLPNMLLIIILQVQKF